MKITNKLWIGMVGFGLLFGCSSKNDDQSTYQRVMDEGVITVATEGTYAPFSYHDSKDTLVGYDVEVAQAIAKELGVEIKFVETKWDGIIAGLDAKKYDIVANQVGITEERTAKYLFSTAYMYSTGVLIIAEDTKDITSFDDLAGKRAAQTITSNWAKTAEQYGAEIVGTDGFDQSIALVTQHRADATLNDNVTYLDYLKTKKDAAVKVAATSEEVQEIAILIRKDDTQLQEKVNDALTKLRKDGTLKAISEKYFGEDISIDPR